MKLIMLSAMYENGGNVVHRHLDGHPELLPARIALVKAEAGCLALHLGNPLVLIAVWTLGAMRPDLSLYPLVGSFFVL